MALLAQDGSTLTDQAGGTLLAQNESPPNAPTLSAGTPSATTVTLTGSAFSDPDVGDTQAAAQWQVTTSADVGYATPVVSTGDDATHLTSYTATGLTPSTAYRARVRYEDAEGNYSAWSADATFTTSAGVKARRRPGSGRAGTRTAIYG